MELFSGQSYYSVISALLVGLLGLLTIAVVKRLYLDPLSRYPGPPLWCLTRIPYMLAFRNGQLAHRIKSFHECYGSIVRVAPNELSFTNPDAIHDIYAKRPNDGFKALPKDPVRFPPPTPGVPISILDALDDDHARIRKAWSPSFSSQSLTAQEPLVRSYVDRLIAILRQQIDHSSNDSTDLQKWISFCTFDIIGSLSFGEDFGCLQNSRYHEWVASLVYSIKGKVQVAACRWYPWLYNFLLKRMLSPQALAAMASGKAMASEKVQRRLASSTQQPDFLSHLAKAKNGLSEAEIETNAATMIFAGSHTLQSAITGTLYFLLKNPAHLNKVSAEVRGAFATPDQMSLKELSALKYLNAVIQEGLRMVSPVPLNMTRLVPAGGAVICGQTLGEGTIVGYMLWAANRSPENFANPDKFAPERWLTQNSESRSNEFQQYASDRRSASSPFLVGPRDCIGQNLAKMEMLYILGKILFTFDLAVPGNDVQKLGKWEDQETYAVWMRSPLEVNLTMAT